MIIGSLHLTNYYITDLPNVIRSAAMKRGKVETCLFLFLKNVGEVTVHVLMLNKGPIYSQTA